MTAFVTRLAAVAVVALALAACGGAGSETSDPPDPSVVASQANPPVGSTGESAAPSEAAPSEDGVASACLDAEVLAALEAYKDVEVPTEPSMEEVADALEALELEGRAAEYRDGVVAALRGETGETVDEMKLHDAMFSLLPLQSEINLIEC